MILMIDNYDSFTFNLVQYLRGMGEEVLVKRNDEITIDEVAALQPEAIILSPGPCTPTEAGICVELVKQLGAKIPLLGICLGHQSIAAALGAEVGHAQSVMHGKVSAIKHDGKGVFEGIRSPVNAVRYHSLAVHRSTLPAELIITAETDDGEIMGLRHTTHLIEGMQFHPESILTSSGKRMLANFMKTVRTKVPS